MSTFLKRLGGRRSRRKSQKNLDHDSMSVISLDESLFSQNGMALDLDGLGASTNSQSTHSRNSEKGRSPLPFKGSTISNRRRKLRRSSGERKSCATQVLSSPDTPETCRSMTPEKSPTVRSRGSSSGGDSLLIKNRRKRRPTKISAQQQGSERQLSNNKTSESNSNTELHNQVSQQATDLDDEGNVHFEKGEYEKAFLKYQEALQLKRSIVPAKSNEPKDEAAEASLLASVATSINNMTYLKQRSGQATSEESMVSYLKALQIKRDILGPRHLSVGKTLNNIGSVFYLKREYEPALKAYEDAYQIVSECLGADHLDSGTIISNIGDVNFAMGKSKPALEHYRKALDIRWTALGAQDPKVVRLMQQVANLETGKQPQKSVDELSDSEDEEYAKEDAERRKQIQIDTKKLQEELEEDMRFFDLMERQMAIDMVKDKTRIFREMRNLTEKPISLEDGNSSFSSIESTSSNQANDQNGSPSLVSRSPVVAAVEAKLAKLSPSRADKVLPCPQVFEPDTKTDSSSMESPVATPRTVSGVGLTAHPTLRLTSEERSVALNNVRGRLSKLRETKANLSERRNQGSRPSGIANLAKAQQERQKHRHYMAPTVSSHARATASSVSVVAKDS